MLKKGAKEQTTTQEDNREYRTALYDFRRSMSVHIEALLEQPFLQCNREALLYAVLHLISVGTPLSVVIPELDRIIAALRRRPSDGTSQLSDERENEVTSENAIFVALKAVVTIKVRNGATGVNLIKDCFYAMADGHEKARILRLLSLALASTDLMPEASMGVASHAASLRAGLSDVVLFTDDDDLWQAVENMLSLRERAHTKKRS